MIPLKTHGRRTRRPVVTWLVGAACTAVLLRLASLPEQDASRIVTALAVVPARLTAGPFDPGNWLTLATSAFLHAGWIHLAGNLLYLVVFGPAVEDRLGHARFLTLYLTCGAAGAVAHALVHPVSVAPLVGASGAIAGLLGAHLVLEPRMRVTTLIGLEVAHLPVAFVVASWFLSQLASGLAPVADGAQATTVAWFAHLGGFGAGCLLAGADAVTRRPHQGRRSATASPQQRRLKKKGRRAA